MNCSLFISFKAPLNIIQGSFTQYRFVICGVIEMKSISRTQIQMQTEIAYLQLVNAKSLINKVISVSENLIRI